MVTPEQWRVEWSAIGTSWCHERTAPVGPLRQALWWLRALRHEEQKYAHPSHQRLNFRVRNEVTDQLVV